MRNRWSASASHGDEISPARGCYFALVPALASPATSEVRFLSPAGGFQFLFPGEDFATFADVASKVSNRTGIGQMVGEAAVRAFRDLEASTNCEGAG